MSDLETSATGATMAENAAPATATVEVTADSDLHDGDEGSDLLEEGEEGHSESGVPKGVRKRFNTLTKQKYELVETVAQLKAEIERRDAQVQAAQLTEPDISNFDDYDQYVEPRRNTLRTRSWPTGQPTRSSLPSSNARSRKSSNGLTSTPSGRKPSGSPHRTSRRQSSRFPRYC